MFLATAGVYALTASFRFADGDGAAEIALACSPGSPRRAYHLVQSDLYRLALAAFGATCPASATAAVHALNIALGALTVALTFVLLRRLALTVPAAAGAAVLVALSAVTWDHATTGETGITAMPWALGAMVLLLPVRPPSGRALAGRVVAASGLVAASVFLSLNMVVLVPALAALVWARATAARRRAWVAALALGSVAIVGAVGFVSAAAAQGQATPRAFMSWLTSHPESEGLRVSKAALTQAPKAFTGVARLLFPVSQGETAVKAYLSGRPVLVSGADVVTLARNVAAAVALLALVGRGLWRGRRHGSVRVLAPSIALTGIFCLGWLGSDPQFWLPVLPLFAALAMIGVSPDWALGDGTSVLGTRARVGLVAVSILLVAVNARRETPSVLWPEGGPRWRAAERAARSLVDGDLLVSPGAPPFTLVRHFRPRVEVLNVAYGLHGLRGPAYLEALQSAVLDAQARGRRVFVWGLQEPLRPSALGPWEVAEGHHHVSRTEVRAAFDRRFVRAAAPDIADDVDRLSPR